MMEQSRHPIEVIAQQTGFADRDRMRRAFLRAFGQPPQVIRRNARAEATALTGLLAACPGGQLRNAATAPA
jgi:transcriptional regulator GlxA family with amidase domain